MDHFLVTVSQLQFEKTSLLPILTLISQIANWDFYKTGYQLLAQSASWFSVANKLDWQTDRQADWQTEWMEVSVLDKIFFIQSILVKDKIKKIKRTILAFQKSCCRIHVKTNFWNLHSLFQSIQGKMWQWLSGSTHRYIVSEFDSCIVPHTFFLVSK